MTGFGLVQVGLLLLCYISLRVIYSTWRYIRFRKFANAQGCEEPYHLNTLPWPWAMIEGAIRFRRLFTGIAEGKDILDDLFIELFKKSWTTRHVMFEGSINIGTIEPANLQAILATQFKDFEVGQMRINTFYPLLGNSIFSSDGAFWEHSRALFRPQFNREQINDLEETEAASQALIRAVGSIGADGWSKNTKLQPLFYNFTLDTATSFLFGESVNSQSIAIEEASSDGSQGKSAQRQFMDDFEISNTFMRHRIQMSSVYWLADGWEFRKALSRLRHFTEQFVQRAIDSTTTSQLSPGQKSTGMKYNLLSALASQTQDTTELRNQTLAILVAGRDTTSGLLGWAFARLSLHPEILTKLRPAILNDFGSESDPQEITFAKLKGCRFLQHFLSEVLRLHPTVPVNNRVAKCNTTLPVGGGRDQKSPVAVYAGQIIVFSVYLMHRRKDLWGEDALEFKPERWEKRIPAWQFLPFSGGPRICIGQQYALTEASYLIVRMLQRFDRIEPADLGEMQRLRKGLGLTMWPGDGVRVRLHRAS